MATSLFDVAENIDCGTHRWCYVALTMTTVLRQ